MAGWHPECWFCGKPVDPQHRRTLRQVIGWERKATGSSRKAGSDIVMRQPGNSYAHEECVNLERMGVSVNQTTLYAIDGGADDG